MYSLSEKQYLIKLSRQAIERYLADKTILTIDAATLPATLQEKRACFVTLTKDFELRGCIGSLEPYQALYLDVIQNSLSAAFEDDRFFPVSKEELPDLVIDISVLSLPQPLIFSSPDDLLNKLTIGVDGVVVTKEGKSATYLPQVWDEILDKHDFMSSLCLKADLAPDAWQKPGCAVATYRVENITE